MSFMAASVIPSIVPTPVPVLGRTGDTVAGADVRVGRPISSTRALLSMRMINGARSSTMILPYMDLLHPYLLSTRILARAMGLDRIGDDVSLMNLQGHVESEGFRLLATWRAGPVNEQHWIWRHRMLRVFKRVELLLPVMADLQYIGERIQCESGQLSDSQHIYFETTAQTPQLLLRCIEHSRKFAVLAHTGAMSTWRYIVSQFRREFNEVQAVIRRRGMPTAMVVDTPAAISPSPPPPAAQRFEDVHIRLTTKEYRSAITPMRGALKRRKDPKVPDNCAICLDKLLLRRTWHGLACGHVFHPKCLKVWLQTQCRQPLCPLCRYDVRMPKNPTIAII